MVCRRGFGIGARAQFFYASCCAIEARSEAEALVVLCESLILVPIWGLRQWIGPYDSLGLELTWV